MIKINNKVIIWFLTNSLFLASLVGGISFGIKGLLNIGIFCVWFMFACSLLFLMDEVIKNSAEKGFAVPIYVDITFDLIVLLYLVYNSFFITGIAYLVYTIMQSGLRNEVEKRIKEREVPNESKGV
jgi:hypothetical protein